MRKLPRYTTCDLMIATFAAIMLIWSLTRLVGHHNPRYTTSRTTDHLSLVNVPLERFLYTYTSKSRVVEEKPTLHTESRLSLEQLRKFVKGRNGYYVRDWSIGLGWNNMKYIIEASLIQAKLLDRVLVIPSFVYARNCEYETEVCSQHGLMIDRGGAAGWDTWDGAPIDSMAWQLPMEIMLDLPKLRSYHPVILTSEFMKIHDLDPSHELLTGYWNFNIHKHPNMGTFRVIPNSWFDDDIFRVDTIQPLFSSIPESTDIDTELNDVFRDTAGEGKNPLSWDNVVDILRNNGYDVDDDVMTERIINRAGWVVTYTYENLGGMEYTKTVAPTIRQVLPHGRVRGWVEDFITMDENILFLEGETHYDRKPGGLRFTTSAARDDYTHFVLSYMRPIPPLIALSEKLARRMTSLTNGRGWFSAHMRRGDFMKIGWVKDASLEAHLRNVKEVFEQGRQQLGASSWSSTMPRENDRYFIATDERNKTNLEYLRKNGAVTVYDLLTLEDRHQVGWPLLFTDVLGIVEQRVAASSAFFYGHTLSSFSGGVLNLRMVMGLESNSYFLDF